MTIAKIARMGHPVLRSPAQTIADPTAPEIRRLIADLWETLADAGGVGLAATQIHVPLRALVFRVPPGRAARPDDPLDGPVPPTVLLNPEITVLDPTPEPGWEGCLSVPGLRGVVPRARAIAYRGLDGEGRVVEREARGFHARVLQHEADHLNGIVYPQRMTDLSLLMFTPELRHGVPPGAPPLAGPAPAPVPLSAPDVTSAPAEED